MSSPSGKIILQSDWDQVLWEDTGKAWVTYSTTGQSSVHSEFVTGGLSPSNGNPYISCSQGFAVNSISKRRICVTYNDDRTTVSRTFVSPVVTYSGVHQAKKSVMCLDVTRGGLAVSCGTDDKLLIWETDSGEIRRRLEGHVGNVYTCQFFPSGVVILTAGADMQIKIWSVETGKCAVTLKGHQAGVSDAAIVEVGRNIVSCSRDGTAKLWDCGTATCLASYDECQAGIINCCSLGVLNNDLTLGVPDQEPGDREVLTQGKMLLLGCESNALQAYGLQSRKKIFEIASHGAVNCCSFLSPVTAVYGTQSGHISIIDLRNHRVPLKEWKENRSAILSLLPYKQGCFASTGDGSCFLVNESLETELELSGSDCDPLYKVVSDGQYVYSACRDGTIRKYRV